MTVRLRAQKSGITIQVGRLGVGMKNIKVSEGAKLGKILEENDFEIGEKENVYLNGDKVSKSDLKKVSPSKDSIVAIVGAKEGGVR